MDYSLLLGIEGSEIKVENDYIHTIGAPRYSINRKTASNKNALEVTSPLQIKKTKTVNLALISCIQDQFYERKQYDE